MDEASGTFQDNIRSLSVFGGNFTDIKGDAYHYHIRGNFLNHELEPGRGELLSFGGRQAMLMLSCLRNRQAQSGGVAQRNSRFIRALSTSTMPSRNTHPCPYPHHLLDRRPRSSLLCVVVVWSRWCRQVCYLAVNRGRVLFVRSRPFWSKLLLLSRQNRTGSRPLSLLDNCLPTHVKPSLSANTHR